MKEYRRRCQAKGCNNIVKSIFRANSGVGTFCCNEHAKNGYFEKLNMIKNKKIRESARNEECSLRVSSECQDGETVVFCHLNSQFRGIGMKSPDIFGVYGCFYCHQILDANKVDHKDQLRALQETQMKLIDKGLIKL